MKSSKKLLLCVVLLLALSSSLFCLSAAADDTYYLNAGQNYNGMIVCKLYTEIIDPGFDQAQGSVVPGLTYDYADGCISVSGTPTVPGTYTLTGIGQALDGNTELYTFTIVVQSSVLETPVSTPAVTETPLLAPVLTKSPTSETVVEGSSAMFIARADEAEAIEWYLIEPGTYSAYAPDAVARLYPELSFSGVNSEVFELYNIPLELNNWQVQCYFSNRYGYIVSEYASIYVEEFSAESPSIKTHPQSAEKEIGSPVLLTVIADNNTPGSTLKYQWYMSSSPSGNRNPISGANSSSYTPAQTKGTVYYTVAVWASYDGRDSAKAYSNPAAVSYTELKVSPSPSPSAAPSPSPTVKPSASPVVSDKEDEKGGSGILLVFIITMILAAALAAVILLILRKNARENVESSPIIPAIRHKQPAPAEAEPVKPQRQIKDWQCSCGALNNSPYCTQCGRAMPVVKPCPNCGWTPASVNSIPHFCPECGKPFEDDTE